MVNGRFIIIFELGDHLNHDVSLVPQMNTSAESTSDANSRTCEVCKRQYTEESATANSTTTKETGGAICDNDKKRQCDICRQNLTDEPRLQNEVEVRNTTLRFVLVLARGSSNSAPNYED